VYWTHCGPRNFLWFSDIALLATGAALWLESSLLASIMTLTVLLPEFAWNLDFARHLLTRRALVGMSSYMFDATLPRYLRTLSLFHVLLPVGLVWLVHRLGYDRRAWALQSLMALVVLTLTYGLTDPAENVNWAHGLGGRPPALAAPWLYLALLIVAFSLVLYLRAHVVLAWLAGHG
jgi:hypothetical protein